MSVNVSYVYSSPRIINGFRAGLVTFRLFLKIFRLALAKVKNPIQAFKYLIKFAEKRKNIQGYDKISRYAQSGERYFFADQIPGYPSEAFNRFMGYEIDRLLNEQGMKPMLNTLIFSITSRCPLQCEHCFEWENLHTQEHLGSDELLKILDKLKPLGLTHIQFGGGEPMVRFNDLISLIKKASPDMDCWILTSGFGLTPEKALELRKAGLTGASISLDHWNEDEHNRFRNHPKSYFWVCEAVKNCHRAGILVNLAVCATKQFASPENIEKYFELAKEWGVGFIKILEARKTGRFRNKDVMLTTGQIDYLMDFYLKSYKSKPFRNYPIVMFPGFDQRQVGCLGAGNRYMYVDSKGEVHSCPFCQSSVGNILHHSAELMVYKLRNKGCQVFELSNK